MKAWYPLIGHGVNGDLFHALLSAGLKRVLGMPLVKRWPVVLLVASFAFMSVENASATTASVSGNWSDTATWGGASVPGAADAVTINAGVTVAVDTPASCASINILVANMLNGITLNNGQSLAVSGNLTTGTPTVDNYRTTIAVGAGSLSVGGNIQLRGSTALKYTELTISSGSVAVAGNIAGATYALVTFSGGGTINISGAFLSSGTFTSFVGSTVNYTGATAQTVKPGTYHNLTLSNGGAKTMTGVTVNGILSLEGTATASVAPTYGSVATLQYNTAVARSVGGEWITPFAAMGGVIITNTGAITLNRDSVLNASVPLAVTSGAALTAGSYKLTLGGIFTNSGRFTSTGTVEWNGIAQNIATGAYFNVIFSGGGVKSIGPGTTVGGNMSIAPSGSAKVSIGAGLNLPVGSLTLGGFGWYNGTWGSSSSIATHANNNFFDLTTGYLIVARTLVYHVVPVNPLAASPFDTWANAATNIQDAVDKASADLVAAGAQCVVLVSNGTYTAANEITITNGIALHGFGENWNDTTIKGRYPASNNRCLNITGAGATVDGFTITNGYVLGVSGGGISMTDAATVQNCLIIGNTTVSTSAGRGGGIYATDGSIINCTIQNNTSLPSGGGGGIYMGSVAGRSVVVSNCLVTGNRATVSYGGGINMIGGLVVNCIISNNVAGATGGGVLKGSSAAATCRNCLIVGNQTANSGGGVGMVGSVGVALENCTIVGNLAAGNGGGVYTANMIPTLNCIVTFNQTSLAGGANDIAADAMNFSYCCSPDLASDVRGNISSAPLFVKAGIGFGAKCTGGNYRLTTDSPCVDTGTTIAWMSSSVDLVGDARVQGEGPNMGAYETLAAQSKGTMMVLR